MNSLYSTLMHVAELLAVFIVVVGIALFVKHFFGIDETVQVGIASTLILSGLMKFLRANPNVPIKDYVNDVKE